MVKDESYTVTRTTRKICPKIRRWADKGRPLASPITSRFSSSMLESGSRQALAGSGGELLLLVCNLS